MAKLVITTQKKGSPHNYLVTLDGIPIPNLMSVTLDTKGGLAVATIEVAIIETDQDQVIIEDTRENISDK